VTLRAALQAALPFVDRSFAAEPLIEARLRMTLGNSFTYLGEAGIAAEQYQRARTLYAPHRGPDHPDTLRTLYDLALSHTALGRHAEALKLHEETLAGRTAHLGPDHADTRLSRRRVAMSLVRLGRHAEAEPLVRALLTAGERDRPDDWTTFELRSGLGEALAGQQKYAEAEPLMLAGFEGLRQRSAAIPAGSRGCLTHAADGLVRLYEARGQPDRAAKWRAEREALTTPAATPGQP
jgi:tetratricopeptide (TPR) repeat protein